MQSSKLWINFYTAKTLRIEAWLEFNEINRIETRGNVFPGGSTAKLKALQKAWYAINDAVIIDV